MHCRHRLYLSILLSALVGSILVCASAVAMQQQNRIALVIGNSSYASAPLANPGNDARGIADTLQRLGFEVILKVDATRRDMREGIRAFSEKLSRNQGGAVFFFAGHGVQYQGANYLIPIGADIRSDYEVEYEAVNASEVLAGMKHSGNPTNIMILDACRNNPFARSFRSASNGLAKMNAPPGSLVAFSTAAGSVAQDGPPGGNSIYTKHLLTQLAVPGLSAEQVFKRVRQAVAAETGQVPLEESSLLHDFRFNQGAADSAGQVVASLPSSNGLGVSGSAVEMEFWKSIKESGSADEYRAFLETYPSSRFAPLARLWLKKNAGQAGNAMSAHTAPVTQPPAWNSQPAPVPGSAPPAWPASTVTTPSPAYQESPVLHEPGGVAEALQRARQAFAAKRLSTPVSDSAVYWSGRALELEPGNWEARQIRSDIVAWYLRSARSRSAKGNVDGARIYLRRAQALEDAISPSQRREMADLEASFKTLAVQKPASKPPAHSASSAAASGMLVLTSEPSAAEVYASRQLLGVTPLQTELPVGRIRLVLKKNGFKNRAHHVEITQGGEKRVRLSLAPLTSGLGSLSIVTDPPGVELYLDGVRKGTTPALLRGVSAGKHELRLKKDGYLGRRHSIEVTGGQQTMINIVVDRRKH